MNANSKYFAGGHLAAQLPHVQIRETIETMKNLQNGNDLRQWSYSSRKQLLLGVNVNVIGRDGATVIGVIPKLALVVASEEFRQYLEKNPDATSVKVSHESTDEKAVAVVLTWLNDTVRSSNKAGINVPRFTSDQIKVRRAAQLLGMDMYVKHFRRVYQEGLRSRIPSPEECILVEKTAIYKDDDMVNALGERMGYLFRTGSFSEEQAENVTALVNENPRLRTAVENADARAKSKRGNGPS